MVVVTQADLENFAGMIGEEVGRAQKTEREQIERQFERMRRRIADLEAMIATPRRSATTPAENTASLIAGRAS
ncbi:hypothetical protein P0R31_10870 [Bradyrhizobium yuanmingense]|uniref:hypothetical protein n=1 Tax=Bradyrhizobium yuanmingense TaxID=108015 RepID=UPI0023BA33A8|nr:hypothetical protein [Bradyrhizobium yuanmingense]MDF0517734.1 hypothetical protein [Bradyrhizobium yuanmingense]